MKSETIQRAVTPTALLVTLGMDEALVSTLSEAMNQGGLRVLRAAHIAAASERIPVVMPQLVVISPSVTAADREVLADRCVAVGAEVFMTDDGQRPRLLDRLRDASQLALIRSMRNAR